MRRFCMALALLGACSMGISAAYAGPGCCAKKDAKTASTCGSKASCSSMASCDREFPKLVSMVGDRAIDCPMTAARVAKENNLKVVYMLGDRKFECQESAMSALAEASESFIDRYTHIVMVADGQAYLCSDDCSKDKPCTPYVLASAKSDSCCMTTGAAKCNSSCSKDKAVKAGSCGSKAEATTVAHGEHGGGGSCGKAEVRTASATDAAKGATCSGKKASTCSSKGGSEVAAAKGSTCSAKKDGEVALAKGEGCCKSKAGLAKAEGCCKSGDKAALVKADKNCMEIYKGSKEVVFRVAGHEFKDCKDAVAMRDRIVNATKAITIKYVVDGKEVSCSSQVCPKAKEEGKVKYVVGKDEVPCEIMARVMVAKARYDAAKAAADEKMAKM